MEKEVEDRKIELQIAERRREREPAPKSCEGQLGLEVRVRV